MTDSTRKLKLWHIAETYPPGYGGGATVFMVDVCRYLAERGHEVRVLCAEGTDAEPYSFRTEYDGPVRVDRLNLPYFKKFDPGGWQLGIRRWREHARRVSAVADELLRDWSPELVQFHTPYPIDEEFLLHLIERGLPVTGMSHCAWTMCSRLNLLKSPTGDACSGPALGKCLNCLYTYYDGSQGKGTLKLPWRVMKLGAYPAYRLRRRNLLRRSIRGQLSYSHYMTDAHQGQVGGLNRFVPLGVDITGLPDVRSPRRPGPIRIGFLAGFQPHKGIWDVLDTAAALKRKGLEFEVHIWGPHQEGKADELAQRDIGDLVHLHGSFTGDQRWDVYAEFDLLVMATIVVESFPRVIQEAAAMGMSVIAPAVGGITEQIRDGVDGLLYKFQDRAHLETQLQRVIESPELIKTLAENLRPVLETREAVAGVEQFYYDVLDGLQSPEPSA